MKTNFALRAALALSIALGGATAGLPALAASKSQPVTIPSANVAQSYLTAVTPNNADGTINIVVTGATGSSSAPALAVSNGVVPRSIVDPARAGNGQTVKVILIGTSAARDAVVSARILGLVTRKDGREEVRLVAAPLASVYGTARTLEAADRQTPGLLDTVKAAFGKAQAPVTWDIQGRKAAFRFVGDAINDFEMSFVKEADKRPLDKDGNPLLYPWPGARNIGE